MAKVHMLTTGLKRLRRDRASAFNRLLSHKVSSMRKIITVFLCFCIASCASNLERGILHYQKQEYDQAAYYWNPLAKQGNPFAQYNVGLLWEYGFGSTQLNKAQAAEWYLLSAKQGYPMAMVKLAEYQISIGNNEPALTWLNLAARWGNETAINKLNSMGSPVPQPDLLQQQLAVQQRRQQEKEDMVAGLLVIGAILGAAAAGSNSNTSHLSDYPTSSYSKPTTTTSTNSYSQSIATTSTHDKSCSSDYSCGIGHSCVKKPFSSTGVCLKAVDSYGLPTYKMPDSDSINIKTEGSCMFNTDCPIGFRCDSTLKACVK